MPVFTLLSYQRKVLLYIGLAMLLAACNGDSSAPPVTSDKIRVISTILPFADWARQVGGDHVEVHVLLTPGASPHTFEPSASDMRYVAESKLSIRGGLHLDDWASKLIDAASSVNQINDLSLGDQLLKTRQLPDVEHMLEKEIVPEANHAHFHPGRNPHFWLDPKLAEISVLIIKERLCKIDPANCSDYQANANRYIDELRVLDEELSATLRELPNRAFVSFHNAFPYLAARYNLSLAAVIEEYPGKTPSEQYLRTVTDEIRKSGIKTIFSEPQLNPRVAEVIAKEVGIGIDVLDPYGTATAPERDTYLETMRYNGARLSTALSRE